MGAHIIRRSTVSLLPPAERRPTTELTEKQLEALINPHSQDRFDHPHGDLEAELELIDARPEVFPDATPESLPRLSSPRLAHTLRRGTTSEAVPTLPELHEPDERIDVSTIVMPRNARPATPAPVSAPVTPSAESSAAPAAAIPSTERPTVPSIPRQLAAVLAASEAEPSFAMAAQELPSDAAASEPAPDSATAQRPRFGAGRARRFVPIVPLLLALGAGAFWLLP